MLDFKGIRVLVTGGTGGIGAAISSLFAQHGAKIIAVYNSNTARAQQFLATLPGSDHRIISCNIAEAEEVKELFENIRLNGEQLNIVINNAGIGFHHPVDGCSYKEWQEAWHKILATNLTGPANVCYHAAQIMIDQGHGRIINVSSRGAFRGEPHQPAYGASKAGLNSLTQSLAYQLASHGIFVGAVAPGFVNTELAFDRLQGESGRAIKAQSPMNRVATPQEVAEAVALMAGSNIWMSGTIFDVNGASYFRT